MKNAGPEGFAGFPVLLCVGEGLAPPESPRARPGEPRAGQATAPTPVDGGCAVLKGSPESGELSARYGAPPKPSASGFGGERRCDGVSETCPASQGRGERHIVCTDESEGLTRYPGAVNPSVTATPCHLPLHKGGFFMRLWKKYWCKTARDVWVILGKQVEIDRREW